MNLVLIDTLEIKDLYNLTTKEEVQEALIRGCPNTANEAKVYFTKTNNSEQKMAIVEMEKREAAKLFETSRITICWINCRTRPRVMVTRCFRFFGFGHKQDKCRELIKKDGGR